MSSFAQVHAARANAVAVDAMAHGTNADLLDFPYNISKEVYMSFKCRIDSFDRLRIGQRQPDMNGGYRWGSYLEINDSTAVLYEVDANNDTTLFARKFHRLAIRDTISVNIFIGSEMGYNDQCLQSQIAISTADGAVDIPYNWYYGHNGAPYFESVNTTGGNVTFSADCASFNCPVWVIGDSYVGISGYRWPWFVRQQGYFNFLLDGLGGSTAWEAGFEIDRLMEYNKPNCLVWLMGMNNPDPDEDTVQSSWLYQVNKLKEMCENEGIELIVSTIPNTPALCHVAKNNWVKNSGLRYIDMAAAVNAGEKGSGWDDGMLSPDNVHPTANGAKALAAQLLSDFPELKTLAAASPKGDVNNDGCIDITDLNCLINITLLLNHRLKYGFRSDINGDKTIDVKDIDILNNIITKRNTRTP